MRYQLDGNTMAQWVKVRVLDFSNCSSNGLKHVGWACPKWYNGRLVTWQPKYGLHHPSCRGRCQIPHQVAIGKVLVDENFSSLWVIRRLIPPLQALPLALGCGIHLTIRIWRRGSSWAKLLDTRESFCVIWWCQLRCQGFKSYPSCNRAKGPSCMGSR